MAEIVEKPGSTTPLPHDKYVRTISEKDAPVERVYIKSRDGLYIAAALRRPKGNGPFPVLIHFHGAPGGRGMEKLVQWSSGSTGGPVWERFLKEGFVVVTADYRGGMFPRGDGLPKDAVTYADDGISVLEYVRALPYVDRNRISLYGVSLGGDVVMHVLARTSVHAAILGAGAPINFLGAKMPERKPGMSDEERWRAMTVNEDMAKANIAPVTTPLLILVGTADGLINLDRALYDRMEKAGKKVRLEIYKDGYHDFVMGPQGHEGRAEPLLDSTLAALESALAFVRSPAS